MPIFTHGNSRFSPGSPALVGQLAVIVASRKGQEADEPEASVDVGQTDARFDQVVDSRATEVLWTEWLQSGVLTALADGIWSELFASSAEWYRRSALERVSMNA
jgi:hypothetical protein